MRQFVRKHADSSHHKARRLQHPAGARVLVQMATPALSQSSYSVMACCKRSKANCCCHTKETPGVAKLKSANSCQGACRFGSLSAPLDTSFAIQKYSSPKLELLTASRIASRRLAAHAQRFDVTRHQRPPPESCKPNSHDAKALTLTAKNRERKRADHCFHRSRAQSPGVAQVDIGRLKGFPNV